VARRVISDAFIARLKIFDAKLSGAPLWRLPL
jgi:hypothetical protein